MIRCSWQRSLDDAAGVEATALEVAENKLASYPVDSDSDANLDLLIWNDREVLSDAAVEETAEDSEPKSAAEEEDILYAWRWILDILFFRNNQVVW